MLFGSEAYLPNEDIAALHRARYNEAYYKYQQGFAEESTDVSGKLVQYYDQRPFQFTAAPVIGRSFSGRISQYNEQTSDIIHHILITNIHDRLINNIKSNLYRDSGLRRMLGHTSGAAKEIRVQVEVMQYPRIVVSITGPFWLRFFYYGRRAFTIHGSPANTKAHGKLVFYDPETLNKIVVSEVHMKAIPPGLYVEKAVADIKSELNSNSHFLDPYVGDVSEREALENNLQRQLDRIRTEQGIQVTALLQQANIGNLTYQEVRRVQAILESKEREALVNLRNIVSRYEAQGSPETRQTKQEVYAALREYLANVKVNVITTSDVLTELPVNLAARSTPRKIIAQYR